MGKWKTREDRERKRFHKVLGGGRGEVLMDAMQESQVVECGKCKVEFVYGRGVKRPMLEIPKSFVECGFDEGFVDLSSSCYVVCPECGFANVSIFSKVEAG